LQVADKATDIGIHRRFKTVLADWFSVPEVFFGDSVLRRFQFALEAALDHSPILAIETL
jgi:hypothetical protein